MEIKEVRKGSRGEEMTKVMMRVHPWKKIAMSLWRLPLTRILHEN
jgi:hypothetical protein